MKANKLRSHWSIFRIFIQNLGNALNIKKHDLQDINNEETVSVVVPFYGVEPYIKECIDSLLCQTHSNLEILCIDDCSPDNSLEIVRAYAEKDSRIKIIRHKSNLGLGGARNTGIKYATSRFICFVDSDDYVSDRFVELLYNTIRKEKSDMVICGFWLFKKNGEKFTCHAEYKNETFIIEKNKNNVAHVAEEYRGATWLKMYKRNLLIDNNIVQPERSYYEDVVFWLKCVFYSTRISTISDRLYYYRLRSDSIMSTLSYKHIDDRIKFIAEIDAFIKDKILTLPDACRSKIKNDAKSYIQNHIDYGKTLINDSNIENKEKLANYYKERLRELTIICE